jgi:zinc-ribbon domain
VRNCSRCSASLADDFRFCPHCGAAQRRKIVEYYRGHADLDDGWLRVSAYLTSPPHVRMSIWRHERAEAAVSLDPDEAHRLGRFLLDVTPPRKATGVTQSLRRTLQAVHNVVANRL